MNDLKLYTFFVIKKGSSIRFENIQGIPVEQIVSENYEKAVSFLKDKYKNYEANIFEICSQGIKEINQTIPKEQTRITKKKEFLNQLKFFSDKFVKFKKDKDVLNKLIMKYE